jgi:ribosomal protein L11 methyltransferase
VLALVVDVPAAENELAADALWALGVVAVEERAGAEGRVELWTSLGDDRDAVLSAVNGFPGHWLVRTEHVDDEVVDTWRGFATPTWIDDTLVVRPAWVDVSFDPGVLVLDIEPGPTFGMGDHPTTILSLRALRRCVRTTVPRRVLDVGCGSGVLAIAAARLGAEVAEGIDISPAAEPITADNAARNGVADRVRASTEPLHDVTGTYDLVLANILAPTLVELSTDLLRVLADDGTLIISGILRDRHDHVLDALRPLQVQHVDDMDGWVAVTLRR